MAGTETSAVVHTTTGTLFNSEQTSELFNKVQGHSALAALSGQRPIPFSGTDVFTFSMDGEASIVGEGANKPAGSAAFDKVTIKPIKLVYQHRVTDEFVHMADEKQIPYLDAFLDGFAKKMARALDICAMHGKNPADKAASTIVGTNNLDSKVTTAIAGTANAATDLQDAIDKVMEAGGTVTGIAMSPKIASAMGKLKQTSSSNVVLYPEFAFGARPTSFAGMGVNVNNTVSFDASTAENAVNPEVYVGDFQNAFRWGYADGIQFETIEYGDPDGQGDLKRTNEIVLRAECYIGWGILNPTSFAKITSKVTAS